MPLFAQVPYRLLCSLFVSGRGAFLSGEFQYFWFDIHTQSNEFACLSIRHAGYIGCVQHCHRAPMSKEGGLFFGSN